MTSEAREESLALGRPVRLYEFVRGSKKWLYTSAGLSVVHNGQTFMSISGLDDDGIRQTGEASADALSVELPIGTDVLNQYRIYPPSTSVGLTVFDKHLGEDDALVQWVGEVVDVKYKRDMAYLICASLSVVGDSRGGLNLLWQRTCPYFVYDHNCRVDKSEFEVAVEIATVDAFTISVTGIDAFEDGYFSGGFIEWAGESGLMETRGISSHEAGALVLIGRSEELREGVALKVFPGCTGTLDLCVNRFNNLPNYGGIPGLPGTSPFDGNPVF